MNKISPSQQARELVQAFTSISSTEELIIFVAGKNEMLSFCGQLIEQYDRDEEGPLTGEVNRLCAQLGVLPGMLYTEVRNVLLALNRFHDASQDHYAILRLSEGASTDAIKKAYRTLSKQYHPDMRQNGEETTRQFMEISGAYHALMASATGQKNKRPEQHTAWRKKGRDRHARKKSDRKKFLVTVVALVGILAGISIILSIRYDEQINSSQVQSWTVQDRKKPSPVKGTSDDITPPPIETVAETGLPSANEQIGQNQVPPVQETTVPVKLVTFAGQPPGNAALPEQQLLSKNTVPAEVANSALNSPAEQSSPFVPAASATPAPAANPAPAPVLEVQATAELSSQTAKTAEPPAPDKKIVTASVANTAATGPVVLQPPREESSQNPSGMRTIRPVKKKPEPVDPSLAVNKILNRYTELYSRRELTAFLDLFAKNAMENGRPQSQFINQYKMLFTETTEIAFNLDDIDWEKSPDGIEAKGTFHSNYTYKNGKTKKYSGSIVFHLTDEQGGLKIRSMEYVFVN